MGSLSVLLAGVLTLAAAGCQPEAQQRAGSEGAVDTTAILSSMDSMRSVFQEAVRMGTTYLAVFHRTEAGWKIVREALSASQPPPSKP